MPVNRAEVAQAQFLEDQAAAMTAAAVGLHAARRSGCKADLGQRAFEAFLRFVAEFEGEFALGQAFDQALEVPCSLL